MDIDSIYEFRRGRLELTNVDVEQAVRASQIVILGVPSKDYKIPVEWLQDDAIVVNVASYKNVDEAELVAKKPNVKFIAQIGRVTVRRGGAAVAQRGRTGGFVLPPCFSYCHSSKPRFPDAPVPRNTILAP